MKKYFITTPIFYVNAAPHIGHAYTQIACDAMTRFLRMHGEEVFFMTGTDEHGEKIEKATVASGFKEGEEKKFVDSIIPKFKLLSEKLEIKYDHFIRTTDDYHLKTVQHVLTALHAKGDVYKKEYKGWFCTPCEAFWSFGQAPEGVCPDCKRKADKLDEENYFFKMSKYQGELIKKIESNELVIAPDMRRNEVLSFLKGNELQDLCISRPRSRLRWGIELPFDTNFVAYVWVDALINYISGLGYLSDKNNFNDRWPGAMHVIGKDIIRHHAIYWPAIMLALGERIPWKIFAHGWWVVEGEKMSKSVGNVVDPVYLIDEKKFQVDALRYFVLSQVQFGYDGAFSEDILIEKYNSDLANDLGNLLNRSLTMVEKYFNAIVPDTTADSHPGLTAEANAIGKEIRALSDALPGKVAALLSIEGLGPDFYQALKEIWTVVGKANKYIEASAPWKCAKANDTEALKVIMNILVQSLAIVGELIYPVMPRTSSSLLGQLGVVRVCERSMNYNDIRWGMVKPGTQVRKGEPLFPRLIK